MHNLPPAKKVNGHDECGSAARVRDVRGSLVGPKTLLFTNCLPVRENSFGDIPGPFGTYDKCILFYLSFDMRVCALHCLHCMCALLKCNFSKIKIIEIYSIVGELCRMWYFEECAYTQHNM